MFTPAALLKHLPITPDSVQPLRWWIALSGGLDSTVLLHALCTLQLPITINALHVNHGISVNADAWQQQCEYFCRTLEMDFYYEKVQVKNSGKGIEDAAREARYAVFERYLAVGDCLLTAHHADDQAETLLLRLLRGTGPRGLAAMARERTLGKGILYRPLLAFSRAELDAYARAQQLVWVDDDSNADDHYDRNYLRNQVMPLLQDRWPVFTRKWQQTAELCAGNEMLLAEIAAQDLVFVEPRTEKAGTSIALQQLLALSPVRRQNLVRYWLRSLALAVPEQHHWQQIDSQLFHAREDAETNVCWDNVSLRRFRARLYALSSAHFSDKKIAPVQSFIAPGQGDIELAGGGILKADYLVATRPGQLLAKHLQPLHIRYRQGGERCKPAGRRHSQTLKRLLQEHGVEPWLRECVPLVYCNDELVAVADLWCCEGFTAQVGESGFRLSWTVNPV